MNNRQYTLISHTLCPYVQRAVIALEEQGIKYKRMDIDLANKPDWFKKLSPLGKVPVLVVDDDTVIFESAVISEYINEVNQGPLLASEPLAKAKQRAWIEFASNTLNNIGQLYNAPNASDFGKAQTQLKQKWQTLEENLNTEGHFNANSDEQFSLVDAAFAPLFRYLPVLEKISGQSFLQHAPKVKIWADTLQKRSSVQQAVSAKYETQLTQFIAKRDSYLGQLAKTVLAQTEAA